MYDLPYRNYDPALGRFFQVDPMAHASHSMTPYHYAGNNPIGSNDPSGLLHTNPYDQTGFAGSGSFGPEIDFSQYGGLLEGSWAYDSGGGGGGGGGGAGGFGGNVEGVLVVTDVGTIDAILKSSLAGISANEIYDTAVDLNGSAFDGPVVYSPWADPGSQFVGAQSVVDCHCSQRSPYVTSAVEAINLWNGTTHEDPYDGHSISIGGSVALFGGINLGVGIVWNKAGDWKFFGSAGGTFGIDASLGVTVKSIKTNHGEAFDPTQYRGWGSSHNAGIGVWDVVPIGGDNSPNSETGTLGATYTESGGGVSFGPLPASYSYQVSYTSFFSNWFK